MIEEIDAYQKAGKIVADVREEAIKMIKDGNLLLDLVEFVESETIKRGAGIAFPCNVSINEITAHYTGQVGDTTRFQRGDMVKLDLGAHIDGFIADSAITIIASSADIEDKFDTDIVNKNEEMVEASAEGLDAAIATVRDGATLGAIGKAVEEAINARGFNPVANLTGHSMEQWVLHSGVSVPNTSENNDYKIKEGDVLAIEPFATDGIGWVVDTPHTIIYRFLKDRPLRITHDKRVLTNIKENYPILPFSKRWLASDFNENRLNASMRMLSQSMAIYPYPALKEQSGCWVSQKEHTVIVEDDGCIIITE
ncbi:MAG: type II methionyl aminopeptidase [Methanobacteriaceae archaeon]